MSTQPDTANAAPIKAVLFDLDGTLLDTWPDFEVVLNRLLEEENKAPLDAGLIRATVSNGARALVTLGFGIEPDHAEFEPLRERLLAHYSNHLAVHTRPFPGIEELLKKLGQHQLPWGIVTNKPFIYAQPLLRQLDLEPAPGTLICPEHVKERKPHPESLYLACEQLGCAANNCIYIGDHRRDIDCGKNAGAKTIAAAYGYIDNRREAESWQADHTVDSAYELWPLIENYLSDAATGNRKLFRPSPLV